MKTEFIGYLWKKVKPSISTNIMMGSSRLVYPFVLSSKIYSYMGYQWITNPYSIQMEECRNGVLTTGKLILQWKIG